MFVEQQLLEGGSVRPFTCQAFGPGQGALTFDNVTFTYPGMLFGHGFVRGRCAVFRNTLHAGTQSDQLPYDVWGLLTTYCKTVDEAIELAE